MNTFYLDGHKIEEEVSGSGSIDPWTAEKARELDIPLMGSSDLGTYIRIDEEKIYRLLVSEADFYKFLSTKCKNLEDLGYYIKRTGSSDHGNYSDSVRWLQETRYRKDLYEKKVDKVKQVIVMRKDLGMRKGKMVAQGSHASLASLLKFFTVSSQARGSEKITYTAGFYPDTILDKWLYSGKFTKICLYVNSEEELLRLDKLCNDLNIPHALITDSGKTEFNGVPTKTCLGIGPWDSDEIDKITGDLALL